MLAATLPGCGGGDASAGRWPLAVSAAHTESPASSPSFRSPSGFEALHSLYLSPLLHISALIFLLPFFSLSFLELAESASPRLAYLVNSFSAA